MSTDSDHLKISVITPSFNAAHYMELSLPPLIRMRDHGDVAEVLVVDDCSTDPSNIETAERLGATLIRMEKNGGPGVARNHAVTLAKGDIIWLVDADVVAHETGPALLREAFADEKVGAVFGSYDDKPPAENFASAYKNLVHRYYHQRGKTDASTFWAGCGAIRRSVYLESGGFNGALYGRPSIEDIELGYRIKDAGWSIRLIPDLLGTHLKRWTLPEVMRTDIFQRALPWSDLILSGAGPDDDLNVSGAEKVKAVLAGLWIISLVGLLVTGFAPVALTAAVIMTAAVIALNLSLLSFFARARGAWFAILATAYHQVYYVYSAGAFAFCMVRRLFTGGKSAPV
ncbi:MAG: glycosyltransferase [Parvularculaceae bacterium]|nr:glycosyltransferase [Parvularculaceae bacterium]